MIKGIIFDIDGTLIDSTLGIRSAVDFVTAKYKIDKLSDDDFHKFLTYAPITASFKNVCKTDENMSNICGNTYIQRYKERDMYKAIIYEGIVDLLEYLKNNKFKLGVATFKNEQNATLLLSHLNLSDYIDVICGSTDHNQTKQDILINCSKQMRLGNDEYIFVGDSKTDAIAAQNLGVKFIGVIYGFGFKSREDVDKFSNILCASTPFEIIKYLQNN